MRNCARRPGPSLQNASSLTPAGVFVCSARFPCTVTTPCQFYGQAHAPQTHSRQTLALVFGCLSRADQPRREGKQCGLGEKKEAVQVAMLLPLEPEGRILEDSYWRRSSSSQDQGEPGFLSGATRCLHRFLANLYQASCQHRGQPAYNLNSTGYEEQEKQSPLQWCHYGVAMKTIRHGDAPLCH